MRGQYHEQRWMEARNTGEDEVPPFGLVKITGASWENPGRTALEVVKCPGNSDSPIAINSWKPIAAGDFGLVTIDGPAFVTYNPATTPAAGEQRGSTAGSFLASTGQTGLLVLGAVDTTKYVVLVDFTSSSVSLTGGCLNEDHPGRGKVFEINLGTWSPAANGWTYSSGTPVKAIDWRFGVPTPAGHATGLFIARPSTAHGTIWETVELDCDSPGECGS